ncbi:MAG: alginate export family protein [Planctomycetota bacterium]
MRMLMACLAVLAWSAASVLAQGVNSAADGSSSVQRDLDSLRRQIGQAIADHERLASDQRDIHERIVGETVEANGLELRLNTLAEDISTRSATDVHSIANPITIFGNFRTRLYYTDNRDFGNNGTGQAPGGGTGQIAGGSGGTDTPEDDRGTALVGCYLIGFDFNFDRDVTTHFAVQAHGGFANGDTPGNESFNSGPLFDSQVLGNQSGVLDEIDLYEGWIQFDNIFSQDGLSWRVGRQEVVLGNEFIFGNNDFFTGENFDGAMLFYESDGWDLHVFYLTLAYRDTFSTRNHPYASGGKGFDDDTIFGIYFEWKGSRAFNVDVYYLYFDGNNGFSRGSLGNSLSASQFGDLTLEGGGVNAFYHTFGARLFGVLNGVADGLDYNVEVAYQTGDLQDTTIDVEGLAIEAEVGILLSQAKQTRIFTRFLYSEGGDSNDTGYIPLFTERHAYAGDGGWTGYRARYGLMNIIPLENVISVQVGAYTDFAAEWTVGATVLWATLDRSNILVAGRDDDIGWEIDLWVEHRYSENTLATFGIGIFLPDDAAPLPKSTASLSGEDDTAFLFYADIRVQF